MQLKNKIISRRKGSTLPCSEEILVKLRKHGPPCIRDKAGIGDIDNSSFSEFILEDLFGEAVLQGCGR